MSEKNEKIKIDLDQAYVQAEDDGAACSPEFGCILPSAIEEESDKA